MRLRLWLSRAAIFALVASSASSARADAQSDAKDLFDRARQLRAAGDCATALPLFHKAHETYPAGLGPLRNAAECEESVGRWASARRTWLDLKRALLLAHDEKYAGWSEEADDAAKRIAPRVAHLTIDVATGSAPRDGLEVTINGEPLASALVATALDRDPGHYVVRAHLGDGAPAEQTFDLVTGEAHAVHLAVAPSGRPLPAQPSSKSSSSALPIAGWIALGTGAALFIGMGVAIGVRQDALSTLQLQCAAYTNCDPSLKPVVSRGSSASTAATIFGVTGGVFAGAGVIMLTVSALASTHSNRERAVAWSVSPFGAELSVRFR